MSVTTDDIVQIIDRDHEWFPCLVIVSDVKVWGIQGYITIPQSDGNGGIMTRNAFIRLNDGTYTEVGRAECTIDHS